MLLVLLLAAAGLLLAPQVAASGALQGLRACAARVIPALLPFFVVSRMLTALPLPMPGRRADRLFRALFGVRAACRLALLTGLLGGYPRGAAAVTELYRAGALSKAEAERALCFCNNSGPGFFAGLIGAAVLGDVRRGLIPLRPACASALLTGLLLPGSTPPAALRTVRREKPVLSSLLPEAVQEAAPPCCRSAGSSSFFSSMLAVLRAAGLTALLPNRLAEALACGALELSSGILLLSGHGAEAACALLMGWGGLCVHFQAMSLWQTAGLRPHGYFFRKAAARPALGRAGPRLLCAVSRRAAVCRSVDRLRTAGSPAAKKFGLEICATLRYNSKKEVARMLFRKRSIDSAPYCAYAARKLDDETYLCASAALSLPATTAGSSNTIRSSACRSAASQRIFPNMTSWIFPCKYNIGISLGEKS